MGPSGSPYYSLHCNTWLEGGNVNLANRPIQTMAAADLANRYSKNVGTYVHSYREFRMVYACTVNICKMRSLIHKGQFHDKEVYFTKASFQRPGCIYNAATIWLYRNC